MITMKGNSSIVASVPFTTRMEFDANVNANSEQKIKTAIILTTSEAKLKLRINTKKLSI